MSKIKLRENLMKLVFQFYFSKDTESNFEVLDDEGLNDADKVYLYNSFNEILENYPQIIHIIESNLVNFKLERISKTDLAILIVAIYELKFSCEKQSFKIIVNEAVELSKKYSDENNYKFVNGLLAKVVNAI